MNTFTKHAQKLTLLTLGSIIIGLVGYMSGLWQAYPEGLLCLVLLLATLGQTIKSYTTWPLLILAAVISLFVSNRLSLNPVIPVASSLAAICVWSSYPKPDLFTGVSKILLTGGTAGAGLWLFDFPYFLDAIDLTNIVYASGWLGLSSTVWTLAWPNLSSGTSLPTWSHVEKTLSKELVEPVREAFCLYQKTKSVAPDADTKNGLKEVALWVYTLQRAGQRLQRQLSGIDPTKIRDRIQKNNETMSSDLFTAERQKATIEHLELLLNHRRTMTIELDRTRAMVDYALAFLEEADASLTVSQNYPGAFTPERLPRVLAKLRKYSSDQEIQKKTDYEIQSTHSSFDSVATTQRRDAKSSVV